MASTRPGPCLVAFKSPQFLMAVLLLFFTFSRLDAQKPNESGIAGGEVRAPVLDEMNRPITAGGFVDGAPVYFADVTETSGLSRFRHRSGDPEKKYIIATMTGGLAVLDYNRDGWMDIYFVNGSTYEALEGKREHPSSALFRNNGNGTFTDVTKVARVGNHQWGFGAVAADFDKDGWVDLYVSNFGPNRLYKNNGDGTFQDVAARAGVELTSVWTTGATFGDYDVDGDLDLFVCGYAKFDLRKPPQPGVDIPLNYCQFRGEDVMCGPRGLKGERDFLFRNNGDGSFTEVAEQAGVADREGFYGFSSAWVDTNNDGRLDLVVVNDSTPNYLYTNNGDGTFSDVSYVSAFALNRDGREQAGMGLAIGDYNLDGRVDFFLTHFSDDYSTLYENQGDDFFLDLSSELGLENPTLPFVSWGTGFLDFDNDGYQDLFLANGHVYPAVDKHEWGTTWAERPLLFRNQAGRRFELMPAVTGSGLAALVVGRGAGFGDFDNDGWVDVVLNCIDSSPRLLRNVSATQKPTSPAGTEAVSVPVKSSNNWVTIKLTSTKSPTDGIGATVYVTAGGRRQRFDVVSGGSFMSSSDPRLHLGLGPAGKVTQVEIFWPSGIRQTANNLPANKIVELTEGDEP